MIIKEINDIYKLNIICTNNNEVMKCKNILEKLGLETYKFDDNKENIIVKKVDIGFYFSNCVCVNCDNDNISFYDFKKQTKSLIPVIPVVQDIEYDEDGRITKINDWKSDKYVYGFNDWVSIIKHCNEIMLQAYIDVGVIFISEEARDRALKKLVIETKLKNIAKRLNNGKIDWNNFEQKKYHISYEVDTNKVFLNNSCFYKYQGSIYCLSEKFLEEAKKEISENELINYFKE